MENKQPKIVQIAPAGGWCFEYRPNPNETEKTTIPVVLWALYDDGSVKGLRGPLVQDGLTVELRPIDKTNTTGRFVLKA
jgi:hypothetical protein